MFKKINTTSLIIALVALVSIVLFNKFYQSKREDSTFRDEFVKIDSSAITAIQIYPKVEKGKEINLIKNGQRWEARNDKIKTLADSGAVLNLISMFSSMKSISLAGQDKSSWNELEVSDTSGTKIKIITNGKTYTMVVGKFSYNPSARNGITYIRHEDEEAVYSVPGFLSFTVNQGFNSWRNKTFINNNKDNWTSITFTYPADSSFMLSRSANEWLVNGEKADSSNTMGYVNSIANMQGTGFVDSYSPASTPLYSMTINGNNQASPITVHAYVSDSVQKFILHSSLNPDAYLSEGQSHLLDKLFKGKKYFIKTE